MATKKLCQVFLLTLCFAYITSTPADNSQFINQTIQINTRLNTYYGNPTWLLILKDEESQRVFPYIFDFYNPTNFWIASSFARKYRVTVSKVSFGPFAEIKNFCHLENRSMSGESLTVTLTGKLSPVRNTYQCNVMRYPNFSFQVVNPDIDINPPNS
jgi:hypothetical protein